MKRSLKTVRTIKNPRPYKNVFLFTFIAFHSLHKELKPIPALGAQKTPENMT